MELGIEIPGGKGFDAVALGLNAMDHLILVPHYPRFNTKVRFSSHRLCPGGQAATAMVSLARLGLKTRYIGTVGADDLGRLQLRSISSEGVDISGVLTIDGAETQSAFIIVDESSGERTIMWSRDERLEFPDARVDRDLITSGRVLHLDGHDVPASIAAAGIARSAGIPTCLDIDNIYPGAERLLPLIDFLISSSTFPRRMTGERDLQTALRRLHREFGSRLTAATLGAGGVLAYFNGGFIHSPAFDIVCRDTTGAGDAFHAGFLFGVLAGYPVQQTLAFANAVAGLKCQQPGARTGLPALDRVKHLLANGKRIATSLDAVLSSLSQVLNQ